VLPVYVANAKEIEAAAAAIAQKFAAIDVWVDNAMVSVFSPVKEMTSDEFRRVTEVA
jgi:NAD(P)-dependent dehydrogenase (short-subunit alcohol dehydrogenase family)